MHRLKLRSGVCKALSFKMIEDRTWSRLPTMEMIALHIFFLACVVELDSFLGTQDRFTLRGVVQGRRKL